MHAGSRAEREGTCNVCNSGPPRYTCPRCRCRYCSQACYKNHSTDCVNAFYQRGMEEALRIDEVPEDVRRDTLRILQRDKEAREAAEQEAAEEQREEAREAALKSALNALERLELEGRLDAEAAERIAASLPETLRDEFSKAIEKPEALTTPPTAPWWDTGSLVAPGGAELDVHPDAPRLPPPLPSVTTLLPPGVTPSPSLIHHVVEALGAYSLAMKAYALDWKGDESGAAELVLDLAPVLTGGNVSSVSEAVQGVVERARKVLPFPAEAKVEEGVAADVSRLLEGKKPLRALHAMELLFDEVRAKAKGREKAKVKARAVQCSKKLHFLQCWVRDHAAALPVVSASLRETLPTTSGDVVLPTQ
eukprot:Sspe_Gene.19393::Locus_7067_Transcript_1_1_Confidence_1.000_Length_1187::g.19393::m.19393